MQNENSEAVPFCSLRASTCREVGDNNQILAAQNQTPSQARHQMWKTEIVSWLSRMNFGKMNLQSAVFPLHPVFFQVERQREKEHLNPDICFAPGQKAAEAKVVFLGVQKFLRIG